MRALLLTACLGLAACDSGTQDRFPNNHRSDLQSDASAAAPKTYSAHVSCRVGQSYVGISACLVGGVGAPDGRLKVRSGGAIRQFSAPQILALERQASGPIVRIDLQAPFEVTAQSAGEDRYVLRVDILEGDDVISSDETAGFGVVALAQINRIQLKSYIEQWFIEPKDFLSSKPVDVREERKGWPEPIVKMLGQEA